MNICIILDVKAEIIIFLPLFSCKIPEIYLDFILHFYTQKQSNSKYLKHFSFFWTLKTCLSNSEESPKEFSLSDVVLILLQCKYPPLKTFSPQHLQEQQHWITLPVSKLSDDTISSEEYPMLLYVLHKKK